MQIFSRIGSNWFALARMLGMIQIDSEWIPKFSLGIMGNLHSSRDFCLLSGVAGQVPGAIKFVNTQERT